MVVNPIQWRDRDLEFAYGAVDLNPKVAKYEILMGVWRQIH